MDWPQWKVSRQSQKPKIIKVTSCAGEKLTTAHRVLHVICYFLGHTFPASSSSPTLSPTLHHILSTSLETYCLLTCMRHDVSVNRDMNDSTMLNGRNRCICSKVPWSVK